MTRVAAGDGDAFAVVVARHRGAVFGYLRHLARTQAQAEDALQETFVSAWRHAADFRGASLRAWLVTIARRSLFRQGRRRAGEPEQLVSLGELGERAGWGAEDPERMVAAAEQRALLDTALARLGDDAREAVVLVDLQGLPLRDAAEIAEVPVAALKSRLHRARLELAGLLREEVHDAR